MRKKLYNASYWLINTNSSYEYSFGVRLTVIGVNGWILGCALSRLYFSSWRPKAIKGERFD